MSITIATQNRKYVVKMDDVCSERTFNDIVRLLLDREGADHEPIPYVIPEEPDPAPEPVKETFPEPVSVDVPAVDLDTQELPDDPDKDEYPIPVPEGYSGFLYIKCEHCGQIHAFCAKHKLTYHKCPDCGNKTDLEDLTPLFMQCECGKRSKYLTNMDEFAFDINCIECGSPVSVKYNSKRGTYETIE